jgi:hypothetical protein
MTIHYTFWASAMFVAAEGLAVFHAEKKGSSNATRRSNATRKTQSGVSRLFVVS